MLQHNVSHPVRDHPRLGLDQEVVLHYANEKLRIVPSLACLVGGSLMDLACFAGTVKFI